ncbi:MAG: hypothetical protein AAGJ82_04380 [Bacteroidota bacterium]
MKYLTLALVLLGLSSCGSASFEDQIRNDIAARIPTGICPEFPKGTVVSNIQVGEIVDIGLGGMTDVSYEFDYDINGKKGHKSSALLYIKEGSSYKLASMGGDCNYEMK